MKVIILGDTHLGVSKSSDIFHDHFAQTFEYMFEYIEQHSISHIIQTGDLYDYRREVHFNTIMKSRAYFFDRIDSMGLDLTVICGNHDSLYKNTNKINSVRSLHDGKYRVIDRTPEPVRFGEYIVDMFPWINDENIGASLDFVSKSKAKYCVGHFEFANFPLYPGINAEHGMDHKLFAKYDTVFSGHYHTRSVKDNVQYIGTPYELTWGDCSDPKGFTVLDLETGVSEFVQTPKTLYTKISYNCSGDIEPELIRDHFVKVIVSEKPNQKKFDTWIETLRSYKPHDLKVIESSIVDAVSEAVASSKSVDLISTRSVIQSVIDNMDTQLDKSVLIKKIMDVYTEAEQILN